MTVGVSENPLSSRKTRWAPSRSAFFYMRPDGPPPVGDGGFVPLQRPALRLLAAPPQSAQEPPDMGGVIADVELTGDLVGNTGQCPEVGPIATDQRALHQPPHQALLLSAGELGRAAGNRLWEQAPWAPPARRCDASGTPSSWSSPAAPPLPTASGPSLAARGRVGDAAPADWGCQEVACLP